MDYLTRLKLLCVSVGLVLFLVPSRGYSVNIDEIMKTAAGIWLFDEGKGKKAEDISGNGNHGELVKNPAWVKGKFGKALEFNGKILVSKQDKNFWIIWQSLLSSVGSRLAR